MTKENQRKIDAINKQIDRLKELIKKCYDNAERVKMDAQIKKCREEIAAIKDSEREPMKSVTRIDDPTILDRRSKNNVANSGVGSIRKLGGGNFSVTL